MIEQIKARIVLGAPRFNAGLDAAIEAVILIPGVYDVEVQAWIPVTERLPEDGSDILGYLKDANHNRFMAANYDKGYWQDCVTGQVFQTKDRVVTHWMPLPEPPHEG